MDADQQPVPPERWITVVPPPPITPNEAKRRCATERQRCQIRLKRLQDESDSICGEVFDLLDELDVLALVRAHTPASRQWLVDRFEHWLRLADRLDADIDDAVADCEYYDTEMEEFADE